MKNNSTSHNRNDKNQSACFNPTYCVEWNMPCNDNLLNSAGLPLQILLEKFALPEYDECMSMHSCAITKKIPLNGTLFIYNSRICFFSRYNGDTLVGKTTIVSIPCSDIISVTKKKTGFIFDQGIEIQLSNNQYFFFSAFKERDSAYNYMSELLQWQKRLQPSPEDLNIECIRQELQQLKQQLEMSQIKQKEGGNAKKKIFQDQQNQSKQNENNEDIIELSDDEMDEQQWEEIKTAGEEIEKKQSEEVQWNQHTDKLTLLFQQRVDKLRNAVLNNLEATTKAKWTSINIKNISAKEVYILFFGNNLFEDEKQQKYNNFSLFYNTHVLNEQNMRYSEITPDPPVYFTNLYENNKLEIIDFTEFSTRKCTFTHPIKEAFMPKSCECLLEEKIYWVSPKEILIERELNLTGIPLSTHFTPRVIYQISESADSTYTTIKSGYYIHYTKDTWFKSKIEKTSDEENMKNWEKISLLYVKYSALWITKREQGQQLQKKQSNMQQNHQIDNKVDALKELSPADIQNQDSLELEFIQSENSDDKQIAQIAEATQSICSIF